jgi:hypothetical protein
MLWKSENLEIWHGCLPDLATIRQQEIWKKQVGHNLRSHPMAPTLEKLKS